MKNITLQSVLRTLFGIFLLLLGFVNFTQASPLPNMPDAHMVFEQAIIDVGYVTKTVGIVEFLVGLMLITNRFAALGLLLLAPISVNFILFKLFLDPGSFPPIPIVYAALNVYLAWTYRDKYKAILEEK